MSASVQNVEHRNQLIEMAETWEMLAAERQRQLEKREKTD
jgi:hypothetical protein